MLDVPYRSLLDPASRLPLGREAVPDAPGLYAWWLAARAAGADLVSGTDAPGTAPLYIGASRRLCSDVEADKTDGRISVFRRRLAAALSVSLSADQGQGDPAGDVGVLYDWMRTNLLLSHCTVPDPYPYQRALVTALDPAFNR